MSTYKLASDPEARKTCHPIAYAGGAVISLDA